MLVSEEKTQVYWGFPLDTFELCFLIKMCMSGCGVVLKRLENNFLGCDWAQSFLICHRNKVAHHMYLNIKLEMQKFFPQSLGQTT